MWNSSRSLDVVIGVLFGITFIAVGIVMWRAFKNVTEINGVNEDITGLVLRVKDLESKVDSDVTQLIEQTNLLTIRLDALSS